MYIYIQYKDSYVGIDDHKSYTRFEPSTCVYCDWDTQCHKPTFWDAKHSTHNFMVTWGWFMTLGLPHYPLVNVYITMENHHVQWENPL